MRGGVGDRPRKGWVDSVAPAAIVLDYIAVHARAAYVLIDLPAPHTATSDVTLREIADCAPGCRVQL